MVPVRACLRDGAPACFHLYNGNLFSDSPDMRVSQRSETTELLMVLSEAARQSLRAGLIEDSSQIITQMLVDIDVEEAKAEQESDHRQLSVRPTRFVCMERQLS